MYTQCPDCRTAFRVGADDLRQAAGKVRCGDCGAAFDALLYLSEELPEAQADTTPEPDLPELKPESKIKQSKLPESISANESIALLQTLDELAGSDIRIEDTGIEWRVLDEVAMSGMGTDETVADDQPAPDNEVRYDDDSPLPDELADDSDAVADTDSGTDTESEAVTKEAETDPEPQVAVENIDADDIDDSGDWEAILDEFDEKAPDDAAAEAGEDEQPESGEAAAHREDESSVDEPIEDAPEETEDNSADGESLEESSEETDKESADGEATKESSEEIDDEIADDESIEEIPGEVGNDIELDSDDDAAETPVPKPGEPSDEDGSPSQWQLLDQDEQDDSIPTLSESQMLAFNADAEDELSDDEDREAAEDIGVESIVLEGDSVHIALEDSEAAASLRAAAAQIDFSATQTSIAPPKRLVRRRGGLYFLLFLLLVALGLQAVHQHRETLARNAIVNDIIGPLYRKIGIPLTPAWDVTGWTFEATTGNTADDDAPLNIYTRIGNRSDGPLPYPLIGVSLTDRFEEVIGSRVLEPSSYLPSDLNPRKMIAPGDSFEAYITVAAPDALASGYKLDVCYRLPDRRLRCAVGDFR